MTDTYNFGVVNPDPMGVVGPNHFVEILNNVIAVFAKTNGQLLQSTDLLSFFAVTNVPAPTLTDPRILYDRDNKRWVTSIIDYGSSNTYDLILAVSKTNTPMDLITNWARYTIKTTQSGSDSDFDTMGMDQNGFYLCVVHRTTTSPVTNTGFTVVAIRKQDIYNGKTNYTVLTNTNPGLTSWAMQPAVNFDPVATNGYAWFVAKGPPTLGSGYKGGSILYRRLQWIGTNAAWVESNWVSVPSTNYQNYYDFDGTNSLYAPVAGIGAPQEGTTNKIALRYVGSRLMMAVIRNGYLWTCQHIGLSGTNGGYTGDQTGTSVDRSAAQWVNFQVGTTSLTYNASGRVYDPAPTNPFWYYFPSLMVNCTSDMVMGFSGSSPNNYIGAYYSWLFNGNLTASAPMTMQPGTIAYTSGDRWGDYSYTSLDPTDDWSFWTVQEYADHTQNAYQNPWATWILELNRDP